MTRVHRRRKRYAPTRSPARAKPTIRCFVSIPFSDRFDKVWANGVRGSASKVLEYEIDLVRLDRRPYVDRIIEFNVLDNIEDCDLLLADISLDADSNNPNPSVMHEIGYATGRRIPIVLIGVKGTHKHLPANLRGSILVEYDSANLDKFVLELGGQLKLIIDDEIMVQPRGDYTVECFTERDSIGIPQLIDRATHRVQIITTNLEYIDSNFKAAIASALKRNNDNPQFKVEILTMDPEGDTTSARAAQLGRKTRQYRDELRASLDAMRGTFATDPKVEIVTYTSLPTQITFIVDQIIITSVISFGQQSRGNLHFLLEATSERASESFIAHFRAMKALAVQGAVPA